MIEQVVGILTALYMADQDAQDINQMMSRTNDVLIKPAKKSKFLWLVLGCVVIGVGLGIIVYQQSIKTKPSVVVKTSPKPLESPTTPTVNVVDKAMESNVITFPIAGKVIIYYYQIKSQTGIPTTPTLMTLTKGTGVTDSVTTPTTKTDLMMIIPTTTTVTAGEAITFKAYSENNLAEPAIGWVKPVNNKCGKNGFGQIDISTYMTWASARGGTLPLVATMCWGEYNANPAQDTSAYAFNNFFIILSYEPPTTSPNPSPSSAGSPNPSPSPSRAASPSPSASVKASASTAGVASVTPTPSARATMPDTSGGTPVTGIFEVTVGTVSVGLILLILGILGLLAL
jgi:hypothetical protein